MIRIGEQVNNTFITTCRYCIQTKADSYLWFRKQIFTGKSQKNTLLVNLSSGLLYTKTVI